MRNKKILIPFIIIPGIIIIIIFIWVFYPFRTIEKLYYIPQAEMYLKTVKPPFDKYGYVLLSKSSIISLDDNTDCIRIYKSETSNVSILMDPNNKDKVFLTEWFNSSIYKAVSYNIERITFNDTTFFQADIFGGTHSYLLKYPYIDITIDGYLEYVYVTDYNNEYSHKIEPVSEN